MVLKISWLSLIAVLGLFLIPKIVFAQASSTAGAISGTVRDTQGAIIIGANVIVRQLATNLERTTQVDEDGSYQISQLPAGDYEVSVTATGFNSQKDSTTINIGTTALVEFELTTAGAKELIEVNNNSNPLIENKTESSTNIDQMQISSLPINQRAFLDFTLTSARVVKDRLPAQGAISTSQLSFNGQSPRFNNITIDGLDNNDTSSGTVRSTFSQDAVQEFQVVSDSYEAEFGRAIGGVINIVTKSGTNSLHSNLFSFLRNDSISTRDPFSKVEPPFQQYQFGATLGGPIKKDRFFYFISFERLSVKQNNIITISDQSIISARRQGFSVTNGAIPLAIGTTSLLARIDGQLTPNNSLWLRYNGGFKFNGAFEPFGGLNAQGNGGVQKLHDNSFAISETYVNLKLNLINEARFLFNRLNQDVQPIEGGVLSRIIAPEGQISIGRSTSLPQTRKVTILQFVDNVSLSRGINQIKFGIDYSYNKITSNTPIFPAGFGLFDPIDFAALSGIEGLPFFSGLAAFDPTLRTKTQRDFLTAISNVLPTQTPGFPGGLPLADLSLPTAYIQGFGNQPATAITNYFSSYIQDDIKLRNNLLIKLGVRYDLARVSLLPKNNGNFAPRIAFAYTPHKLEKLRLHGAFGLFFGSPLTGGSIVAALSTSGRLKVLVLPFPFSILPYMQPDHHYPVSEDLPNGVTITPQLSQGLSNDPNIRNGYTEQLTTGINYAINKDTVLDISYNYVRGIKVFSSRNINPVVRPSNNPLQGLMTGRLDPTRGDDFQFQSAYDTYYNGLTLTLERRLASNIGLLAHYTFSKALDNYTDFRGDLQEYVDPLNLKNERSLSLQDVRSRLILSGIWDLAYSKQALLRDYQLSAILTLESGRPYNLRAGVDLNGNGDNPPGDRPLNLGRNAGITPGFASLDLRLTRSILITEKYRLQLLVEGFNIFNRLNISQVDNIFPPDINGNFNLPKKQGSRYYITPDRYRAAFPSRQLQFGVKFLF